MELEIDLAGAALVGEKKKEKDMKMEKTCSFTGHRPQSLPFGSRETDARCVALKELLFKQIERLYTEEGVTHFISGMAVGVDTFAAEAVLTLRDEHPEVTLEAAIPCESQAEKWTEAQRDRYYNLLERCDKETLISRHYTPECMHERNRYMVDNSDFVIAVWDGRPSGTGSTVRYAQKKGKNVFIIDPKAL